MNDLEIKGMKLEILINCKERREENLSCEDWEDEIVIRAYKLLEE